eukprot:EG_transcript_5129
MAGPSAAPPLPLRLARSYRRPPRPAPATAPPPVTLSLGDLPFYYYGHVGPDALRQYTEGWRFLPTPASPAGAIEPQQPSTSGGLLCALVGADSAEISPEPFWNVCLALAAISRRSSWEGSIAQSMVTPQWLRTMELMAQRSEADLRPLEGLSGQQMCRLVNLFGRLRVRLGPAVCRLALRRIIGDGVAAELTGPGVVEFTRAMAGHRFVSPDLVITIGQRLLEPGFLAALPAEEVAALTAALGELRVTNGVLFEELTHRIAELASELSGSQVAEVCTALAAVGHLSEALALSLADRAAAVPLSPSELVALGRAFAAAGDAGSAAMARLLERALSTDELYSLSPAEATSMLFAVASAGISDARLTRKALPPLLETVGEATLRPAALGELVSALALLNVKPDTLLQSATGALATSTMDDLTATNMHQICCGLARLHCPAPGLLPRLADAAVQPGLLATFTAPQMAEILRAYSTLGLTHPALIHSFASRASAPDFRHALTASDIAHVACALAALPAGDPATLDALASQALAPEVLRQFTANTAELVVGALASASPSSSQEKLLAALQLRFPGRRSPPTPWRRWAALAWPRPAGVAPAFGDAVRRGSATFMALLRPHRSA